MSVLKRDRDSIPLFEGHLLKKGGFNPRWRLRYCILFDDRTIDYYNKKQDAKKGRHTAKGTIYLTQVQ